MPPRTGVRGGGCRVSAGPWNGYVLLAAGRREVGQGPQVRRPGGWRLRREGTCRVARTLEEARAKGKSFRQPSRQTRRRGLALDEAAARHPGRLRRLDARRHTSPAEIPGNAAGSRPQNRGTRRTRTHRGCREEPEKAREPRQLKEEGGETCGSAR